MPVRRATRPAADAPAARPHRGERRRAETRARLLRAARQLMARKGVGAVSIQEITDAADVGFGSFYNHFASKEAIVDAVMAASLEVFGDAADRLADTLADPAEVLAASVRHAVLRAAADEAWGWFLVRTGLGPGDALHRGLGPRLARDIARGVGAGRFDVGDEVAAKLAAGGAILAIIAARLHRHIGDDAPERAAAVVLELLGVPRREARAIAARPLPRIPAPPHSPPPAPSSTPRRRGRRGAV